MLWGTSLFRCLLTDSRLASQWSFPLFRALAQKAMSGRVLKRLADLGREMRARCFHCFGILGAESFA